VNAGWGGFGGGYQGGNAGGPNDPDGFGGRSYNNGSSQSNATGVHSGHGRVTITAR